jgi:transposase
VEGDRAVLVAQQRKVGRPLEHDPRTLWDAIQYIAATGCQWAHLPKDFPPFTTVQYHFYRLRDNGLLDLINEALVTVMRVIEGRHAEPTAGVIDSQS